MSLADSWSRAERDALAALAGERPRSILVVHERAPRFDASGSDLRLMQLLRALAAAGHRVCFVGRQAAAERRHVEALEALGIEVREPDPEAIFWDDVLEPALDVEALCAERRFDDALLFHWYWLGASVAESWIPRLRRASPATRVVLLTDDVHALREERRAHEGGGHAAAERALALAEKESAAWCAADLVLAITEEDAARMSERAPGLAPLVVGFCQEEIPERVPAFEERSGLVFLGSGQNDANARAVAWLLAEVWPRVRAARPDLRLTLVGEPPAGGWAEPESLRALGGVEVAGQVEHLEPWLDRARVFASPIPYGTGLKTKNVQALGRGLPLVLTTISAEGMRLTEGSGAVVCDDAAGFAEAVLALEADRERWSAASRAALAHARATFSRERVIQDLARALASTRPAPPLSALEALVALAPCGAPRIPTGPRSALARLYAARLVRAEAERAAGHPERGALELRLALCELCCLSPDHPTLAQLFARLASCELSAGLGLLGAASAQEALRLAPLAARAGAERALARRQGALGAASGMG